MADFTVIVDSGAQLRDWLDPPTLAPSRLNPRPGFWLKRWVGSSGAPIILKAVVDGDVAPLDTALGGRLFVPWTVEAPVMPFVGVSSVRGQSSVIVVRASIVGHYTIGIRRPDGGAEHVHLDVG